MNVQTQALATAISEPRNSGTKFAREGAGWLAALLALTAVVILVSPTGFMGGGWDDWQYLNAARCWREFGPCLPTDHWQSRWPVIAPLAAIISFFGESRLTVSLWPLAASLACLLLLARLGNQLFGRPVGWIASLLLVLTPAFSLQLLTPRVEAVELALILAGALATIEWARQRRAWQAVLAGFLFGIAIQVRETALIASVFAAVYVLSRYPRPSPRHLLLGFIGFAIPIAIEFIVFAISTGDALWRRKLSVAHTLIISSELRGPVDPDHPPFFNATYIGNWIHEPGVHIHWALDGLINLFVNAKAGLSLLFVPALLWLGRPHISAKGRAISVRAWAGALIYASILIYALAVDPKARVMLVPLCATHLALALLTWELWKSGRRPICFAMGAAAVITASPFWFFHQNTQLIEAPATAWMDALQGQVEIDPNTRRHLTLIEAARELPGLASTSPYLIYSGPSSCSHWLQSSRLPIQSVSVALEVPRSRIALNGGWSGALCLFRYERELSEDDVRAAIEVSRRDGPYILAPRSAVLERD